MACQDGVLIGLGCPCFTTSLQVHLLMNNVGNMDQTRQTTSYHFMNIVSSILFACSKLDKWQVARSLMDSLLVKLRQTFKKDK